MSLDPDGEFQIDEEINLNNHQIIQGEFVKNLVPKSENIAFSTDTGTF